MYYDQQSEYQTCESISSLKNIDADIILLWSKLGRVDVIKQWSEEIKSAVNAQTGLDDWALVGHAITIIHDDKDVCAAILQRVAHDVGFEFVRFDAESIQEKFYGESFNVQFDKPTLVYLEPDKWMHTIEDSDADKDSLLALTQKRICSVVEQFDPKHPVIFATSVEYYDEFSEVFRRVGLFDRRFAVIKPSLEELADNFIEHVGAEICGDSLKSSLGKVGKLLDLDFDDNRRQKLVALTLKRIAKKESRMVEFSDLVNLAMRGSAESDDYPSKSEENLRQVAIHEAGHAAIAMIDSNGANTPEYASIIESDDFAGIVSDSYSYHYAKDRKTTNADFRHKIRNYLAGRVAEHLVLGAENIATGSAKSDLKKATNMCFNMFAYRGIAPEMDTLEGASSNLAVALDPNSPSNLFRVETMVRDYLQKQYIATYKMLEKNRKLLDAIVEQLMKKRMLDQQDLMEIGRMINNNCKSNTNTSI
jgi:hypothetical protein